MSLKTAIIFGKFLPFHNGHLYMIERAIKENDKVIIFVCSESKRDNQLFADSSFIYQPHKLIRKAWIEQAVAKYNSEFDLAQLEPETQAQVLALAKQVDLNQYLSSQRAADQLPEPLFKLLALLQASYAWNKVQVISLEEDGLPSYPNGWQAWAQRVKQTFLCCFPELVRAKHQVLVQDALSSYYSLQSLEAQQQARASNPELDQAWSQAENLSWQQILGTDEIKVYTSEPQDQPNYKKYLDLDSVLVDPSRVQVTISGTKCRQQVFTNYYFMPQLVRKFFIPQLASEQVKDAQFSQISQAWFNPSKQIAAPVLTAQEQVSYYYSQGGEKLLLAQRANTAIQDTEFNGFGSDLVYSPEPAVQELVAKFSPLLECLACRSTLSLQVPTPAPVSLVAQGKQGYLAVCDVEHNLEPSVKVSNHAEFNGVYQIQDLSHGQTYWSLRNPQQPLIVNTAKALYLANKNFSTEAKLTFSKEEFTSIALQQQLNAVIPHQNPAGFLWYGLIAQLESPYFKPDSFFALLAHS